MPLETKYENDFANQVQSFCTKNNVTIYVFDTKRTGVESLIRFVEDRQGTISSKTIGRVKAFMKSYKPKK